MVRKRVEELFAESIKNYPVDCAPLLFDFIVQNMMSFNSNAYHIMREALNKFFEHFQQLLPIVFPEKLWRILFKKEPYTEVVDLLGDIIRRISKGTVSHPQLFDQFPLDLLETFVTDESLEPHYYCVKALVTLLKNIRPENDARYLKLRRIAFNFVKENLNNSNKEPSSEAHQILMVLINNQSKDPSSDLIDLINLKEEKDKSQFVKVEALAIIAESCSDACSAQSSNPDFIKKILADIETHGKNASLNILENIIDRCSVKYFQMIFDFAVRNKDKVWSRRILMFLLKRYSEGEMAILFENEFLNTKEFPSANSEANQDILIVVREIAKHCSFDAIRQILIMLNKLLILKGDWMHRQAWEAQEGIHTTACKVLIALFQRFNHAKEKRELFNEITKIFSPVAINELQRDLLELQNSYGYSNELLFPRELYLDWLQLMPYVDKKFIGESILKCGHALTFNPTFNPNICKVAFSDSSYEVTARTADVVSLQQFFANKWTLRASHNTTHVEQVQLLRGLSCRMLEEIVETKPSGQVDTVYRNRLGRHCFLDGKYGCVTLVRKEHSNHVYIIMEELNQNDLKLWKAELCVTDAGNSINAMGHLVTIIMEPIQANDLDRLELVGCVYKCWQVTSEQLNALRTNIKSDQLQKSIKYNVAGDGSVYGLVFPGGIYHNCLSWAMAKLSYIGLDMEHQWLDNLVVYPAQHLRAENNPSSRCVVC